MGTGIAQCAAAVGMHVVVREADEEAARRAALRLRRAGERAAERGMLGGALEDVLARVAYVVDWDALGDAKLAIEAVPENADLKASVLACMCEVLPDDAIIATNTSSFSISGLAGAGRDASRVLGLHFFSPVPAMPLVEVIPSLDTSPWAVDVARHFVGALGKRAIVVPDRPGFVVNALLVPFLLAAARMAESGVAAPQEIDDAMRLGCGHPLGPLALADAIGLDVLLDISEVLHGQLLTADVAPPPVLRRLVSSGRLGRKTGEGFHRYANERS
jgi:3-hydroxybutyryl-CoA dehydrogenase